MLFGVAAPGASADFDPPDGTLIQANLPNVVSLGYSVDPAGLCGGPSTAVAVRLRYPDGSSVDLDAQNQAEGSVGPTLSAVGIYQRAVVVTCGSTPYLTEQGSFTLNVGEPETTPPPGTGAPGPVAPGGTGSPTSSVTRACKRARAATARARTRLATSKRALKRGGTAQRRRAVKTARKAYRTARRHARTACAK